MKKLLFTLPFLFMGQAHAQNSDVDAKCKSIEELAYVIMQARQSGRTMSSLMEIAGDDAITRAIVIDAYNVPRYATDRVRKEEIIDFSTNIASACYTALSQGD